MTLTQRCALTVQLHSSIAHIPGGALSTLPGRNTRHHKNTDHTIARSHFSPFRALNTLLLPLIFVDPRRSSEGTKGRVVQRPRSIAFDSLARRSSSHRLQHTVTRTQGTLSSIWIFLDPSFSFSKSVTSVSIDRTLENFPSKENFL